MGITFMVNRRDEVFVLHEIIQILSKCETMTIGCLGSKLQKKLKKSVKIHMKELGFNGLKDFCLRHKEYFDFKDEFEFNPVIQYRRNEIGDCNINTSTRYPLNIWSYKDEIRYVNFLEQCKNDPVVIFENGIFMNKFANKLIKPEC